MNVSTLFTQINGAYRGTDDDAPAVGTADYDHWLSTTNRKLSEWARDNKNTWQSLFEVREIGTIAAGTQTYDLDDEILIPADSVIVTTTDGVAVPYRIVKPQERDRWANGVYISGRNPQTLTFVSTIDAGSAIVGGTISLGGFFIPDELAAANGIIPVDDPYWLVYAVASELAFNDLTYEDKAADLNNKANNLYAMMVTANRKGSSGNPRTIRTKVDRIRGNV